MMMFAQSCGQSDLVVGFLTTVVSVTMSIFYTNWRINAMLKSEKQRFLPVTSK
jgi:hypothetical protein